MADDRRNNSIVSGPERFRWPWARAQDVNIGSATRTQNSTVNLGSEARAESSTVDNGRASGMPRFKAHVPGLGRLPRVAAPAGWRRLLVLIVVLPALIFHIAPQIHRLIGEEDARGLLAWLYGSLPMIDGFEAARWLTPATAAWMWQPIAAAGGAALLRLVALNAARREPIGALWIAFVALLIDASTWLFMGLKLQGQAFDADQAAALITLLKVEAGALFVAFAILAPTGKKRFGKTDAEFAGDN